MKLTYPAIFSKGEGGYAVEVPERPAAACHKRKQC
jgi:hypothetical protein